MPKRVLIGKVVSDKMDKTVVVQVERTTSHARYSKIIKRSEKYKAHDEQNQYHVGDMVKIEECRPLSKEKCWVVLEKISSSAVA